MKLHNKMATYTQTNDSATELSQIVYIPIFGNQLLVVVLSQFAVNISVKSSAHEGETGASQYMR